MIEHRQPERAGPEAHRQKHQPGRDRRQALSQRQPVGALDPAVPQMDRAEEQAGEPDRGPGPEAPPQRREEEPAKHQFFGQRHPDHRRGQRDQQRGRDAAEGPDPRREERQVEVGQPEQPPGAGHGQSEGRVRPAKNRKRCQQDERRQHLRQRRQQRAAGQAREGIGERGEGPEPEQRQRTGQAERPAGPGGAAAPGGAAGLIGGSLHRGSWRGGVGSGASCGWACVSARAGPRLAAGPAPVRSARRGRARPLADTRNWSRPAPHAGIAAGRRGPAAFRPRPEPGPRARNRRCGHPAAPPAARPKGPAIRGTGRRWHRRPGRADRSARRRSGPAAGPRCQARGPARRTDRPASR